MKKKSFLSKGVMAVALAGVLVSSWGGISYADTTEVSAAETVQQTTKYPSKVMEEVRLTLGIDKHSTELDSQINSMPKVEVMDRYLTSFEKKVKGPEVRQVVFEVFAADLNMISENNYGSKLNSYDVAVMESVRMSLGIDSQSTELDSVIMNMTKNEVMDRYIEVHNHSLTGPELRVLINKVFGVNLDGISGLEHARLSIYSKGQWILKGDTDLFIVSSSNNDVTVYVSVTDYFTATTGSNQLPESLVAKLTALGYTYNAELNAYSYTNPTGESVPDALKGQTMGAVVGTIQTEYPIQQ